MELNDESLRFSWRKFKQIDQTDIQLGILMATSICIVWIYLFWAGCFSVILTHDRAYQYVYVAKNMYRPPKESALLSQVHINTTTFYQVYPGVPFVLRLLSLPFFGQMTIPSMIYILTTSVAAILLFRRFLQAWHVVTNPDVTSYLFLLFPLRFFGIRCVVNSDSLLFCCIFMCLIAFKLRSMKIMLWTIIAACLTDTPGVMASFGVVSMLLLKSQRRYAAIFALVPLACLLFVSGVQYINAGSWISFFTERIRGSELPSIIPFGPVFMKSLSITTLQDFHTIYTYQFMGLVGLAFLFFENLHLFVFGLFLIIHVITLDNVDVSRDAFLYEVFVVLVGLDVLMSNDKFRKGLPVFVVCYFIVTFIFTKNTLESSRYIQSLFFEIIGI